MSPEDRPYVCQVPGRLVKLRSESGLELDGMLFDGGTRESIVVHVHGSFGNFYQNKFLWEMARAYTAAGISLLTANMSAHDGVAEGYYNKEFRYVGGALSDFEESVLDIRGIVKFASKRWDNVILQGHSLGCDRVLHYMVQTLDSRPTVLLSPCDSYALHRNWRPEEQPEDQVNRLQHQATEREEFDWIPAIEYGVRQGQDWVYSIPITRRAFLSIADGPPFHLLRIGGGHSFNIEAETLVLIGRNDRLQVWPSETMIRFFEARFSKVTSRIIDEANHMFGGAERVMADAAADWVALQ